MLSNQHQLLLLVSNMNISHSGRMPLSPRGRASCMYGPFAVGGNCCVLTGNSKNKQRSNSCWCGLLSLSLVSLQSSLLVRFIIICLSSLSLFYFMTAVLLIHRSRIPPSRGADEFTKVCDLISLMKEELLNKFSANQNPEADSPTTSLTHLITH